MRRFAPIAVVLGLASLMSLITVVVTLSILGPESPENVLFDGTRESSWAFEQAANPARIQEVADPAGSKTTVLRITARKDDVAPRGPVEDPLAALMGPARLMEPGR